MWWPPKHDFERDEGLKGFLERMNSLFGEGLSKTADVYDVSRSVYGFGSALVGKTSRVPLLVLDVSLDDRYDRLARRTKGMPGTRLLVERIWHRYGPSGFPRSAFSGSGPLTAFELARILGGVSLPNRFQKDIVARRSMVPLSDVDYETSSKLSWMGLPSNTYLLFSRMPKPTSGPLGHVYSTPHGSLACTGLGLRDGTDFDMVTTVAHALQEVPCALRRERRDFLRPWDAALGNAVWWSYGQPLPVDREVDVAVIHRPAPPASGRRAVLAHVGEGEMQGCLVYGAKTPRKGYTLGALQKIWNPNSKSNWRSCYLVSGDYSGLHKDGDSGARTALENGAVLGHVVAGIGYLTEDGRYQSAAVQDVHTLLECLRSNFEQSIEIVDHDVS